MEVRKSELLGLEFFISLLYEFDPGGRFPVNLPSLYFTLLKGLNLTYSDLQGMTLDQLVWWYDAELQYIKESNKATSKPKK